jgi:glyoxylase-like metal-dependent hydrolase (beta-lactamase superfamily II)
VFVPSILVLLAMLVVGVGAWRPAHAESGSRGHGALAADTVIKRDTLAAGIYLFRVPSDLDKWTATNTVVIVNENDVVVFDSNTRPGTARTVIGEIRKLTPKPVRTLINSHWHMDHWSGNDEYVKAFPGLTIIASTETRDYMKRFTARFFASNLENAAARQRAGLDTAVRTGRQADGTPLTAAARREREADIAETAAFAAEVAAVPRVLPNLVYGDTLAFWSGSREFRLMSVTGDATGSTVLYLPREKVLVMGDVLVRPESGDGPPPWTTNSYAITPWLNSLRALESLDAAVIVPGQGAAFRDKAYLRLTGDLFASVIAQVHAALERGVVPVAEVQKLVNVDSIGRLYTPGASAPSPRLQPLVAALVRKAHQEALDGVVR